MKNKPICPFCNKEINNFKDALSLKEFSISGICQECQNRTFKKRGYDGYLTKEETEEFKKLIKEVYGIELTFSEAEDQGTRLTQLFELLQRSEPIPMSVKDIVENDLQRVKD